MAARLGRINGQINVPLADWQLGPNPISVNGQNPQFTFGEAQVGDISLHNFAFQKNNTQASCVIDFNWSDLLNTSAANSFIPTILGFSRVGDNNTIQRFLPWRCPYAPWLYASSLTNIKGAGKYIGKTKGQFGGVISNYDRARGTITWASRPYAMITDAQLANPPYNGDESQRYVEKLPKPTAEYISIQGYSYVYTEGTLPTAIVPQPRFPLPLGKIDVKVDLEWIWHEVPDQWINNVAGVPSGLFPGLGCVNANLIWGFPAGTLLALPPQITPIELPVNPTVLGLPENVQPRAWDVHFLFKFWDPPLGPGATTRGHNTAIFPRNNKYYLIKSVDGPNTVYKTFDFANFFKKAPRLFPVNP